MTNDKIYDLEERTALFSEAVIEFAKLVPQNAITTNLIIQFVKSGTSMGANYCEADAAESRKDFEHKMGICKKEAKETRYWLRIIAKTCPELKDKAEILWKESHELLLIFSAIIKNTKNGDQKTV
ncbi:MAG: four helix bundle protein [Candidatus Doudnabacteria bacterium]|nr:four helix bundle protein [Candidatus Doudnabacteria bacterium]